jgi:hypothetical protein
VSPPATNETGFDPPALLFTFEVVEFCFIEKLPPEEGVVMIPPVEFSIFGGEPPAEPFDVDPPFVEVIGGEQLFFAPGVRVAEVRFCGDQWVRSGKRLVASPDN